MEHSPNNPRFGFQLFMFFLVYSGPKNLVSVCFFVFVVLLVLGCFDFKKIMQINLFSWCLGRIVFSNADGRAPHESILVKCSIPLKTPLQEGFCQILNICELMRCRGCWPHVFERCFWIFWINKESSVPKSLKGEHEKVGGQEGEAKFFRVKNWLCVKACCVHKFV